MLSLESALDLLSSYDLQPREIGSALSEVDQTALYQAYLSNLNIEIWDRVSPINGVAAAKVLARRDDIGDGPVYLIKERGRVLYFQPFKRAITGYQPIEDAMEEARNHVNEIAWSQANSATIAHLLTRLTKKPE